MLEHIPEHILAEFLVRLPFKSLIQFRCVSKSWRDWIDSRYFIGIHSTRSRLIETHPHPDSKIIAVVEYPIHTQLYTIDYDSVVENGKGGYTAIANQLSMPASKEFLECKKFWLVGSCNGILCVYTYHHNLILWNPFTARRCFKLPSPPHEYTEGPTYNKSVWSAFGYDHINDDYKVVMYYQHCPVCSINPRHYELCVYSLKHKLWTTIRSDIPFDMPEDYFFTHNCTSANGALHWLVGKNFIVAFDLATYEFRKLSCCCPSVDPCDMNLCFFDGCLSIMCFYYGRRRVEDLWMMEEYGVGTSWTKLVSIKMGSEYHLHTPVAFFEGRRKLLLQNSQNLAVYDVERRVLTKVEDKLRTDAFCVCVGSFASPTTY